MVALENKKGTVTKKENVVTELLTNNNIKFCTTGSSDSFNTTPEHSINGTNGLLVRGSLDSQQNAAEHETIEGTRSQSMASIALNRTSCVTAATMTAEATTTSAPVTPQRRRTQQPYTMCHRVNSLKNRHCPSPTGSTQQSDNRSSDELGATSNEIIRIRVICPSARVLIFQMDTSKRLVEVKNEVILQLSDDPASMPLFATDMRQLGPRYRLFRAEFQGVEMNESQTLAELNINNNESFVLTPRRTYLQQASVQSHDTRAPRSHDIEMATRHVAPKNGQMPMVDVNEIFQQSNIQFDVRKVLISLAQASAAVIGSGPYAPRLITMLKQKLINKRKYHSDTQQCLVEMGFTQEQAEYALRLHNGVYSTALEYLLQRQSDATNEKPMVLQKSSSILSPSGIVTNNDIAQNTAALLEIVHIYSHRDIPPMPETVEALLEMGFEEADVMVALRKTCNNKAAACEWLCGNRSGSLVELRDGLAQDSPILKAILELPQVQMNLSNPKVLLAFLAILENENSIRFWGGDNDTTSVITHILQKYHEEKHVLGINQFYNNRI